MHCSLGLFYRKCQLVSKEDVTHDTKLFGFMLPPSTHLRVPVGQHVYLKVTITGKAAAGFRGAMAPFTGSSKQCRSAWDTVTNVMDPCFWAVRFSVSQNVCGHRVSSKLELWPCPIVMWKNKEIALVRGHSASTETYYWPNPAERGTVYNGPPNAYLRLHHL